MVLVTVQNRLKLNSLMKYFHVLKSSNLRRCTFCTMADKGKSLPPHHRVLVSTSHCIYENLALEEWLYLNAPLEENSYLLMWRNKPTVVLGRHQNPWVEANIPLAREQGVHIARRASGGGTVYHDMGNLNLSFLTSRDRYNRKRNLELVVTALNACCDADISYNDRDDILLNKFYKISGTAAKLGRVQSYHHLTLLHSLDFSKLHDILASSATGISSKATKSLPAAVKNLIDEVPLLTFDDMIQALSDQFLTVGDQKNNNKSYIEVNPTDESLYPGVREASERLQSWPWMYGKTPKFSIQRQFTGHQHDGRQCTANIDLTVDKGKVIHIGIDESSKLMEGLVPLTLAFYTEHLIGEELTVDNLTKVKSRFDRFCDSAFIDRTSDVHRGTQWLSHCVHLCLDFV